MREDERTWVDGAPTFVGPDVALPEVPPYVVEGPLGQGGMSTVYRARGPDGALVALKILHDLSDKGRVRFEREAAVRIEHDNVVRVFDAGFSPTRLPYIALELLDGETLAERGRREPLELPEVIDVGLQGSRGLERVHASGLVHRDVKPSNLFCCADGTLKVLDFGVARRDDDAGLTTPGSAVGTPKYMSPEQARGAADVDARSDVWSLGAVMYEALAGFAPFDRGAPIPTLLAAARGAFRPLSEVAPHVPTPLARIVDRALSARVAERFDSAAALRGALESVGPAEATRTDRLTPTGVRLVEGAERIVAVLMASFVSEHERLEAAVRANGGEYLALAGQSGIGLFGVETWYGDEVRRAVDAALAARSAASAFGVASGRATQGGDHIVGQAVDLAVAGAALAVPGVAIDVETARALGGARSLVRVAPNHLEVERTRGSKPTATRLDPLVGRQSALETIATALFGAVDGAQSVVVTVTGVAGVGKTRLCEEAIATVGREREGVDVVRHAAASHRSEDAYGWFVDALLARFAERAALARWPLLRPGVPLVQRRRVVRRFVSEVVKDAERVEAVAESIGALFGVPMIDDDARTAELGAEDDRIRAGLFDYFDHLTLAGPVVLFVDRADWIDARSRALAAALAEQLADRPLAIVVAARDAVEAFSGRPGARAIALDELPREDALALARRFAQSSLTDAQLEAIVDRAEGNPAFVAQLVRVSREQGAAVATLPLSVEAAVQARIDRLAPPLRALTAHLALFARPFELHEARRVVEGASDAALDVLLERGFLVRTGEVLAFASALVAEVASRSMTDAHRRSLHRRMADVLARYPDADAYEVATHLEAAGAPDEAGAFFARAAQRAARVGDSHKVVRAVRRAVECGLTEGLVDLYLLVAQAQRFLGDGTAQLEALEAASVRASTPRDRARITSERALWLSRKRRAEEAIDEGQRAIDDARVARDDAVLLLAQGRQSFFFVQAGRWDEAEQLLTQVEARLADAGVELRARAAGWRGQLEAARGHHAASRAAFARAAQLYQAAGDLRLAASAQANLADLDNRLQDPRSAAMNLRRAASECRRVGNRLMESYALVNLGHALTTLGHHAAAQAAFRDAALILRATPDPRLSIYLRLYRARGVFASGRTEGVRATADQIAAEAERRGLDTARAHALALAARVALAEADPAGALERIAEAAALVEAGRVDEDEAAIAAVHVAVLDANGRAAEADAVAAQAADRIEVAASRIGDEATRERFLAAEVHAVLRARAVG